MGEPTRLDLPSAGDVTVAAYRWDPAGEPRGVVQLTHGMGEHVLRYEHLAAALPAGFVVHAQDHRGHGATAPTRRVGGSAPTAGTSSSPTSAGSARSPERHPGLPLVLFGHSMGSFAAQQYLLDHSAESTPWRSPARRRST